MPFKLWRPCLLKRGAFVVVNVNYSNTEGAPPQWMSGTLLGTAQQGRVCRVRIDDTGDERWAGETNLFSASRVKRAITR